MSAPLYVSSSSHEIQFINNLTSPPTVLHVSKPTGEISVTKIEPDADRFATFGHSVPGILGVIRLWLGKYVIVISKAEKIGLLKGHVIYRIADFDFIPTRDTLVKDKDEATYLSLLKKHIKHGPMYFSYTWDLTNSLQRQAPDTNGAIWRRADERFFWNQYVQQEFINYSTVDPAIDHFILPVVFGYVKVTKTSINNTPLTFGLISRRSRFRAGTRYFSRGIDGDGNVSNFNETEQVVVVDSHDDTGAVSESTYGFVQTRGSVPVFWAEINNLRYKPKLRIIDAAVDTARAHFDQQVRTYGPNYCVNLVNQAGHEQPVKNAYETVIRQLADPDVRYVYFDFHHECRKMRYDRVQGLIDRLVELGAGQMGYYHAVRDQDSGDGTKVKRLQQGTVRTNCMDCLDRTNVVQSVLAGWTLQHVLQDAGVLPQSAQDSVRWESDAEFELLFRNTWADNADAISRAYSGTGALKTDFTRTGKRTKKGAANDLWNSIERYGRNNFFDGRRQDAYDLFLGNHHPYDVVDPPFRDLRPVIVQSMPYVAYGALLMILAAWLLPRANDARVLAIRLFTLAWVIVLAYAALFIRTHGLAYVNWPRLVPLEYVTEQEVVHAGTGRVRGWVMSEKGKIENRIRGLEEGKKRTE
ncbi:SacI homology domain-containing protein [Lipomyces japonicus]|uniref:SacI homology domain-containing protein n=1 Tax=Lipomyces japonicus TaxID=56871 RepID=UPI0034CFC93A